MPDPAAPPVRPEKDASEDILSSLEAMLDEVSSERDARLRLLADAGGAPAAASPAAAIRPKARRKAAAPDPVSDPAPDPDPAPVSDPAPGSASDPAADPASGPPTEARIAALRAKIEKARAGLVNRDARIAELKAERDALRAELEKMRASRSWRLTAPLRRLRG
ncbi:hypothetical protein [Jannaschia formosa]|uniref:hypothetical protein n=1 Tax=Jannaschia formosa TaxID=2259592 RepID=UPI000E1B99A5|nr:hypothetical protein [Jannaschia formosa]TFL17143.1 hypothetical protein DR046_16530 [Jannaschia formosa]